MKRTNQKALAVIMAILLVIAASSLLGCSASENATSADMVTDSYYPTTDSLYDDYDYDVGSADYDAAPKPEEETVASTEGAEADAETLERKIIRNADVEMEADDANACYDAILANIKTYGGYESNFNSRSSEYSSGTYVYIEAELRMPPEKLDEFIGELKNGQYGEVTYCSVTSDEVTEEYYDLATRLESKERALDSYYALLEKAETIDEVLSIQSRIDGLTEEIESIKGRLRLYDSLVDESTIYIDITQYTEKPVVIEEKEFEWNSLTGADFLKIIKNGFLGVCNFVWSALQWIAIILISLSPLLIIAGAVVFVVLKIKKNRAKKTATKNEEKADESGDKVANSGAPDYK